MTQHKDLKASVWVLTQKHKIIKVDSNSDTTDISPDNFASMLSFNADKTLWVLPVNNNYVNNQLIYSEDEGQRWVELDIQQIQVVKLSATHLGACFVLTPEGAVFLIHKSGQIDKIFIEGTANDIAVSPEGYIWVISREKKDGGGNLVYWCVYDNFVLQPVYGQPVAKKISVGPEGTARIITIGGEIASLYLNRMGGLETPGGVLFGKNIAASCHSNTIWVISSDKSKNKKRNVLKFWNPDIDPYMEWHTINGIEPYSIAGGE